LLFGDEQKIPGLYYALSGHEYAPGTDVRLIKVSSGKRRNDLIWAAGDTQVVLTEHMSSAFASIPYRLLCYTTETYEHNLLSKEVKDKLHKHGSRTEIPRPSFFVVYNGNKRPKQSIVRLSDLYPALDGDMAMLAPLPQPQLELLANVVDVNFREGEDNPALQRCNDLEGYARFVHYVRECQKRLNDVGKAVSEAMDYCARHNILREFLSRYDKEVKEAMTDQMEVELFGEEMKAEGLEEGREQGREEGREEGLELGTIQAVLALLDLHPSDVIAELLHMPSAFVRYLNEKRPSLEDAYEAYHSRQWAD